MFWFLFCWLESHNHFTLVVKPKATLFRSSRPKVFLGKDVLKICSKFTGEHSCWSAISIKLLSNFIKIAIRHECSPVNLMHIFRTPFYKNSCGGLHASESVIMTSGKKIEILEKIGIHFLFLVILFLIKLFTRTDVLKKYNCVFLCFLCSLCVLCLFIQNILRQCTSRRAKN